MIIKSEAILMGQTLGNMKKPTDYRTCLGIL